MNILPLIIGVIVILIIGLFGTILIGKSKQNKQQNPEYDKKTKSIFISLGYYYLGATLLLVGFFLLYLYFK